MKKYLVFTLALMLVLGSCDRASFNYDPTKSYPRLAVGEYWVDKFDSRGLQNATLDKDNLLINTKNGPNDEEYLYNLDLQTGKVAWSLQVKNWASSPALVTDKIIYYVSYTGDVYGITKHGRVLWENKLPSSYGGHALNPINNNLIIKSTVDGLFEFDATSGKIINHFAKGRAVTLPVFDSQRMIYASHSLDNRANGRVTNINYHSKDTIWAAEVAKDIIGLLIGDDKIVAYSRDTELISFSAVNGSKVWSKQLQESAAGELPKNLKVGISNDTIIYSLDGAGNLASLGSGAKLQGSVTPKQRQYLVKKDDEAFQITFREKFYDAKEVDVEIKLLKIE